MTPAAIREEVLAAVERGDLPCGGPSELAALDMIDRTPASYWRAWAVECGDPQEGATPSKKEQS